eukprot:1366284-Amorphochlora_amoeboformis.AAC.1
MRLLISEKVEYVRRIGRGWAFSGTKNSLYCPKAQTYRNSWSVSAYLCQIYRQRSHNDHAFPQAMRLGSGSHENVTWLGHT